MKIKIKYEGVKRRVKNMFYDILGATERLKELERKKTVFF
jgi:hypothetical protein